MNGQSYDREEERTHNTGLAKVAVQCSADTFVVKIATFAKRQTVIANARKTHNQKPMEVLLSIKPEFANKIFEGTKRYEYRRVIFKNPRIKKIVVYASAPISKLIGEFEIEEVLSDQISIYGQEKDNATRALAVMNMWLHGKPSAEIVQGNTLAEWS